MKITKSYLKRLIKEHLNILNEANYYVTGQDGDWIKDESGNAKQFSAGSLALLINTKKVDPNKSYANIVGTEDTVQVKDIKDPTVQKFVAKAQQTQPDTKQQQSQTTDSQQQQAQTTNQKTSTQQSNTEKSTTSSQFVKLLNAMKGANIRNSENYISRMENLISAIPDLESKGIANYKQQGGDVNIDLNGFAERFKSNLDGFVRIQAAPFVTKDLETFKKIQDILNIARSINVFNISVRPIDLGTKYTPKYKIAQPSNDSDPNTSELISSAFGVPVYLNNKLIGEQPAVVTGFGDKYSDEVKNYIISLGEQQKNLKEYFSKFLKLIK